MGRSRINSINFSSTEAQHDFETVIVTNLLRQLEKSFIRALLTQLICSRCLLMLLNCRDYKKQALYNQNEVYRI